MYDLYSASLNFTSSSPQYPNYCSYTPPSTQHSCAVNMQAQSKHDYRGYNSFTTSMSGSASSALPSCARVPPLSHPPIQMVDRSVPHSSFYEDPYRYKIQNNYQTRTSFQNHVQYATPTTKDYCDDETRSEKSSDNDQGNIISFSSHLTFVLIRLYSCTFLYNSFQLVAEFYSYRLL